MQCGAQLSVRVSVKLQTDLLRTLEIKSSICVSRFFDRNITRPRLYYWLPQLVIFAIAAAVIIERSIVVFPRVARAIAPALMLMIAGNLLSLPSHWNAIRSQEHKPWIVQSPMLRGCVRDTGHAISEYGLDAPDAQLCLSLIH